jgi:hypothetical protein
MTATYADAPMVNAVSMAFAKTTPARMSLVQMVNSAAMVSASIPALRSNAPISKDVSMASASMIQPKLVHVMVSIALTVTSVQKENALQILAMA